MRKTNTFKPRIFRTWLAGLLAVVVVAGMGGAQYVQAQSAAPPPQNPQKGSVGLEGTISAPPPTRAATISNPANGQAFATLPITVNGLCPQGTMVKVFSNNIFMGAARCTNGSYNLQIDLFGGQNDLVARVFDDLDQPGPDSNTVRVNFNDAQFSPFGNRVSLSSTYAKKGANPGATLSWPIIISGGSGPYAMSFDWGDGKPPDLKSIPFADTILFEHVYDAAGVYRVVVKVTDVNGVTGYLQLIGVANGEARATGTTAGGGDGSGGGGATTIVKTKSNPIPSLIALPLILATFWLGRKYELQTLRRRIEESTSNEYNR